MSTLLCTQILDPSHAVVSGFMLEASRKSWRKAQNRFCLEVRGRGEKVEVRVRGRNDPNSVCTCE
jgi:hypothetical protein